MSTGISLPAYYPSLLLLKRRLSWNAPWNGDIDTSDEDVTVGFDRRFLGCSKAVDFLSAIATPVTCLPKLAFPFSCLGPKGLNSTVLGCLARITMNMYHELLLPFL